MVTETYYSEYSLLYPCGAVSRAAFRKVQMGERFARRIVGQSDDRALPDDLAQGRV